MDCEHGTFSERDCADAVPLLAAANILALVRLRNHDTKAIGTCLDMDVDAVIIPNVSTPAQATTCARAVRYPPSGTRSFGASLHRATRYGLDIGGPLAAAPAGPVLLVMIESTLGVENAEQIAAVEGVDGVVIGPWDLTADMGRLGDFSQPGYVEALSHVERAVSSRGKLLGTAPHPGFTPEVLLKRGYRILTVGADMPLIRDAMSAQVATARSCLDTTAGPSK